MTSVLEGLIKEADLRPDVKLQPHQERVLKRLREHPANMLLFHALGSGKTLTGLAASEQTGEPFTAVVPASLRNNMRGEYEKFLDPQSQQKADVMSYSGLARGKPVRNPSVLLFDEAARLRNPATLEARMAMELASRARQTTLLTGTPITNDPSDLAVPISMLTGRQITPKEFTDRYVGQRKVGPGFFGWLRGVPPATEPEIKRPEELKALLSGHVDYYAPQQPTVPTTQEDIPVEMSTDQSRLYHAMWGQLPWLLRWKLQHDYPLSNADLKRATSFLVGPRQVGLSTYTFQGENRDPLKAFQTSTKLQEAHKRLADKLKDPRTKALVFSNFIDAGLTPYAAGLAASNIPHAIFHGGLSDKERQKLKDDYNSGKIRVALLGPSGTEGLSFKGTQLVQLLDPYWNSARGSQSKGRALRYDSHWDLPEDLKNVTVQRYTSKLPLSLMARLKQRVGFDQETQRRATDDYLENMAARKDRLNRPFIDLLKDIGSEKVGNAHTAAGCPLGLALLLDSDVPDGNGGCGRTVLKSAQAWLPLGYALERERDGDNYTFRLLHGHKHIGGLRARRGKDAHSVEEAWLDPAHRTSLLGGALAAHIHEDHSGQSVMLPDGSTIPVDAITSAYQGGGFDALPPLAEKSAADEMEDNARNWVKHVMQTSFATYPPPGIFTRSPQEIADAGDDPGVAPKGLTSWQRMVLFHRNRGGRGLAEERRKALQDAIQLLSQRRTERQQKPELYDPTTLLPIKTGGAIAHVAGPSGSGKSTLLDQLAVEHPYLITKDLDEFDEEATKQLNLPPKWKTDYSDEMLRQLADRRQQLMNDWLNKQKQPVVLGGHHVEGKNVLDVPADHKLLLNTSPLVSAWRGYRRSQKEEPQYRRRLTELPQDWSEARRDVKQLKGLGYKPTSLEDIKSLIAAKFPVKEGAAHVLPEMADGRSGDPDHPGISVPTAASLSHKENGQAEQGRSVEVLQAEKAAAAPTELNSAETNYATGIPNRSFYGEPHVALKPGQLVDWIVQEHLARRAGKHWDLRLGTPETGLFSWASRKGLPEPGQKRLAVQQPLHSHGYGGFEGEIPSGYGAGTVKKHDVGQALITKAGPEGIHFTLAHRRFPERFLLLPPKMSGQKNWLMLNTTKTKPVPYEKTRYATIPPEKVEGVLEKLQPGSSVQAKLDGAASLVQLFKDHAEVLSYRTSKENRPIVHTERTFGTRPEAKIPKDLVGTVLRGELYGTGPEGKAIDPQELGGLLNSSIARSMKTQAERGINMRNMLFDIDRLGGGRRATDVRSLPYEARLNKVREIMPHLNQPGVFHGPEEAKDPESAKALWHRIAAGQHPLTEEGIVIHPPHGRPAKVKIRGEHDVYIRGFAPGAGKYKDNAVGTFRYSHEPEGPIVGEVGTGLTDSLRRDMHQNPDAYLGRVARVLSPRKTSSGALYAPALLALHEDK